jgi:hypothetical protein
MNSKRGWLLDRDGNWHAVPHSFLDDEEIPFPFHLDLKMPGKPVRYLKPDDWYKRHDIVPGESYIYLRPEKSVHDVSQSEIDDLLSGRMQR